jgi:serine/threonine protein kinase
VNFIVQIFDGLMHLHDQQKYFEFGDLREENIHLSALLSTIYIDPGFYLSNELYPEFFDPPEGGNPSVQTDIYQIGIVLLRLVTLLSRDEIEELFKQKEKKVQRNRKMSLFQKRIRPDYIENVKSLLNSSEMRVN